MPRDLITYAQAIDHLQVARIESQSDTGTTQEELRHIAAALDIVDHLTRAAVTAARQDGQTWEQVGYALGVTKQAAQQRYGTRKQPPHRAVDPQLPLD